MQHRDRVSWLESDGLHDHSGSAGPLHALAREIEETQRRQGETLAQVAERLRALDRARAGSPVPPLRPRATLEGAGDDPWDLASAEALMQACEADAAASPPRTRGAAAPPQGDAHPADVDQEWLGERFADVTQRIKRALSDLKPGTTVALLEERLDAFQRHIAAALEDVVRRADLEGLRLIESHVADLDRRLAALEQHVARLDGIEADVQSVLAQVSDERLARLVDGHGTRLAADLEAVAQRLAEEMHARFARDGAEAAADARRHEELRALIEASIRDRREAEAEAAARVNGLSGRLSAQSDRYDELKALLEQAIDERRRSDETAAAVFDALQQGLVSVLDRLDALEQPPPRHEAAPAWLAPASAPPAFAPHAEPEPRFPVQPGPLASPPPVEVPAAFADPGHAEATLEVEPDSAVDRLRRDFIADARRAKLKAAANRAEAAAEKPEPKRGPLAETRAALAQAARAPLAAGSGRLFGASPKLLAGALAVVVAINGGLLFLSAKDDPPPAPEITISPAPGSDQGAAAPEAAPSAAPAPGSHSSLDGGEAGPADADASDAARPAPPASDPTAGPALTPYGLVDDVLTPPAVETHGDAAPSVPGGMAIARPGGSMPDDVVADIYEQQVLASLSGKLGSVAAAQSPEALLPEQSGRIDTAYSEAAPAPAAAGDAAQRAGALDLPPATVGPLSLRLAAANGDASAEFEVAARLAEGKGTGQDFAEAMRWYQRSASKGFAQAQYRLGTLYERGLGTAKDIGRAKAWYVRAAEQGNVKSMHNLAVLAAGGETGADGTPDYATALRWFTRAAEHGLADSQYNLAVLLENGLGTAPDKVAALKWYTLAAKSGDADAVARRDALAAALGAKERAESERQAAAFSARPALPLANDARAAGEDWKRRAASSNT